ncbi:SDR family oxidoreductase [Kribbella alba]|uniref:SDR family oxidoreductase n=1 Tax=Kribbella alba TaxID=190197 RepID=A0ABN2F628_9ACTN
MRIAILGANGPTGRLLTEQALAAGHDVVALTRRPDEFPIVHQKLVVAGGDVLDPDAVDPVVDGSEVVLSALGTPFTKEQVEVYSGGGRNTLDAMKRFGTSRFVVVTSGAVTGEPEPTGGFLFNRVLQPYVTNVLGKTVYDDMRRLEELMADSDTDWTVLRPSGLFDLPEVTEYSITAEHGPGRLTSRRDLAAALLLQATDQRFVRKVAHVITTVDNPSLLSMMWREARKK